MRYSRSGRHAGTPSAVVRSTPKQGYATATLARTASALSGIGIIDRPLPSVPPFQAFAFADIRQISFFRKKA
ncbi:hypothetical protein RSPO_m01651 (plasmid) [Ralstonia solanacearum Po82]|uniref:Uncharacterized protein n=1 Tax=Ralstonia solanacearum (strain Po82) TaxID=1031711 RepID=F6GB83_RALS8|nr:hypothetical protein RSPO_m01651 [Ralstonia solanacearum Po82]